MADVDAMRAWVDEFVARESQPAQMQAWVVRVQEAVLAQSPDLSADASLTRLAHETIESHWRSFLATLKDPQHDVPLVQSAADLATDLARRGFPLTVLFHVYRVAQREVWRYMTTVVSHAGDAGVDGAELLVFLWERASTWLDSAVVASADVFRAEHERIRRGTAAQQLETVREVLGGKTPDNRDIVANLGGHPISGFNTAVLLHTEEYREITGLTEAVTRLGKTLGVRNPLVVNPGGRDLWCWFGTRSEPDLEVLRQCEAWLAEHGITAAVGTPGEGVEGFRISHREAQQAEKIAFAARTVPALTLFADVELLCLVSASPEATRRFVTRTLGPLGDPGEGPARLRETLHALLASGSVDEAATALSVHKNTVRYRVNQAETMMGHPATRAPSEVELALRYHAMFIGDPENP
ncbi:MAG TPA: helix-turn-helix domain-containing protein [Marmoricola sp.]